MRRTLTGNRPDKPLLLTVSRLAPEKSVGALARVLESVPGCCLAIVGDGPQRAELERHFSGMDARFVGYLKGEDLAAAYASADAFVYASETETMGSVILEAMASGLPVVAPRAGGIPTLVEHDHTGLLYTPGAPDDAEKLTRSVVADVGLRSRLGRAARSAVEGCDWKHSIGRVRDFYSEAIEVFRPVRGKRSWGQRSAGVVTATLVSAFRARAAVGKNARYSGPRPTRRRLPKTTNAHFQGALAGASGNGI